MIPTLTSPPSRSVSVRPRPTLSWRRRHPILVPMLFRCLVCACLDVDECACVWAVSGQRAHSDVCCGHSPVLHPQGRLALHLHPDNPLHALAPARAPECGTYLQRMYLVQKKNTHRHIDTQHVFTRMRLNMSVLFVYTYFRCVRRQVPVRAHVQAFMNGRVIDACIYTVWR